MPVLASKSVIVRIVPLNFIYVNSMLGTLNSHSLPDLFEKVRFSNFSPKETKEVISNEMSFNVIKFDKAIVKIAVN